MGKPMSLNLIKAGYPLIAYDINPEPLEALKEMLPKRTTLILEADTVPPFDLITSETLRLLQKGGPTTQPAGGVPLVEKKNGQAAN